MLFLMDMTDKHVVECSKQCIQISQFTQELARLRCSSRGRCRTHSDPISVRALPRASFHLS